MEYISYTMGTCTLCDIYAQAQGPHRINSTGLHLESTCPSTEKVAISHEGNPLEVLPAVSTAMAETTCIQLKNVSTVDSSSSSSEHLAIES